MKPEKRNGKWRVRVYIGEVDGKKKWKSVTADTKKDALMKAAKIDKESAASSCATMQEAVKRYIDLREPVLSPSSVRMYRIALVNRIEGTALGKCKMDSVTNAIVQKWVSGLALELSPKSVRNYYSLITSTISMFAPGKTISVRLPQKIKKINNAPTSDDVKILLEYFREAGDTDMLIASLLSACGSMRRGEICALYAEDIRGNVATISRDVVRGPGNEWIVKDTPKTSASARNVPLPKYVVDMLPKEGKIVDLMPEQLTHRFERAKKKCGVNIRFHDLRHYWATIMLYSGIPSRIVQSIGGWETDAVMKNTYLGIMEDEKQLAMGKMSTIFEEKLTKS